MRDLLFTCFFLLVGIQLTKLNLTYEAVSQYAREKRDFILNQITPSTRETIVNHVKQCHLESCEDMLRQHTKKSSQGGNTTQIALYSRKKI